MDLIDLLIETEPRHLDWCADPSDLVRALARQLGEVQPADPWPVAAEEKGSAPKLAGELQRIVQH